MKVRKITMMPKREYLYWLILLGVGIFYFFFAGEKGYVLWSDSAGYIKAHYEREPLYPLLLMACRMMLGEKLYLYGVVVIQSIAALTAVIVLMQCIRKEFRLNRMESAIAYLLLLLPYGLDTMWSEPRSNYTHAIMTDALSYSMFYFYVVVLIRYLKYQKWTSFGWMVIWSCIMTLNRSQMQLCYVVTGIAVLFMCCNVKGNRLSVAWKKILVKAGIVIGAFGITIFLTYCYSYWRWGEFARSSENDFTTLTNLLYASDPEDEALFQNPETAEAFRELYGRVYEAKLTHHYAPEGFLENGYYMLQCHDPMKSRIVRTFFIEYIEDQGLEPSFRSDQLKKELASEMKSVLMREHFWEWIYNGLCMAPRGVMYAVMPIIPPGMENIAYVCTVVILGLCIVLYVMHMLQTRKLSGEYKEQRICLTKWIGCMVMFMGMNIVALSIIILVNCRYVNYTQGLFYIMLYLVAKDVVKVRRKQAVYEEPVHS